MATGRSTMRAYEICAHRGWRQRYPENTVLAIERAAEEGVDSVEFDVQVSADGVPFVLHDTTFRRTGNVAGSVFDTSSVMIQTMPAHEPERFGDAFLGVTVPRLSEVLEVFCRYPKLRMFLEIKDESIDYHGVEIVADILVHTLEDFTNAVIISDNATILRVLQQSHAFRIGWVIRDLGRQMKQAQALSPQYLIINHNRIRDVEHLPVGGWRWMCYEVNDNRYIDALLAKGVCCIETASPERVNA